MILSEPKHAHFSLNRVLKKYPVIRLDDVTGDRMNADISARYRKAREAGDYETCKRIGLLPPLFPEFVIQIDPSNGGVPNYILVYYETPESLYLLYFQEGKKFLESVDDLTQFSPESYQNFSSMVNPISDTAKSLGLERISAIFNMVHTLFSAVTEYMLYYSPELEYAEPKKQSSQKGKRPQKEYNRRDIILKSKRLKYTIPREMPRRAPANYKVPSWRVRGHYQRVGKDKHWIYIRETIAHRKGFEKDSTPPPPTYKIKV